MSIDEKKYNNLFITTFKASETQLNTEFERVIKEYQYSDEIKLAFYNAAFDTLIKQFKNEISKDENYEHTISTIYQIYISALKEDNINTSKLESDLARFKTIEVPEMVVKETNNEYQPQFKNYNLNTKYGRKKAREQAVRNYENGTTEYRNEIDKLKFAVWIIIIVIVIVIFISKRQ